MKKLKFPTATHTGLTIECRACNKDKTTHNSDTTCKSYDKWNYKVRVRFAGKSKSKVIKTRDLNDAFLEALDFINEKKAPRREYSNIELSTDVTVLEALVWYLDFINNVGVANVDLKNNTKGHVEETERVCKILVKCLEKNSVNLNHPIRLVNRYSLDYFSKYLKKKYSARTHNKYLTTATTFFKKVITKHLVPMQNPLDGAQREKVIERKGDKAIIGKEEFQQVIQSLGKVNPYEVFPCLEEKVKGGVCFKTEPYKQNIKHGGEVRELQVWKTLKWTNNRMKVNRKNHFRSYLPEAWTLALLTGCRREEWSTLSWDDIYTHADGVGHYIKTSNLKVERIFNKIIKPKYIQVTKELAVLLKSLGWHENYGSNNFIIFPERGYSLMNKRTNKSRWVSVSNSTIIGQSSKSFRHFYRTVFEAEVPKQMKCLRKTYLTLDAIKRGYEKSASDASLNPATALAHYINDEAMVQAEVDDFW